MQECFPSSPWQRFYCLLFKPFLNNVMMIAVAFAFPCLSSQPSLQHYSLPLSSRVLKSKTNAPISFYYNCSQGLTLFFRTTVKIMIEFRAKLHLMEKMCAQLSTVITNLGRLSLKKWTFRKVYINNVTECGVENTEACSSESKIIRWQTHQCNSMSRQVESA